MKYVRAPGPWPCHKRTVLATVVTVEGDEYAATNQCQVAGPCPRDGMPTGVRYDLCNPVHAEARAVSLAGDNARGALLYVEGHTYACDLCKSLARDAGITAIIIGQTPRREAITRDIEDLCGRAILDAVNPKITG